MKPSPPGSTAAPRGSLALGLLAIGVVGSAGAAPAVDVDAALEALRAGRHARAARLLRAGLAADPATRVAAGRGVVEFALRSPRPWVVLRDLNQGTLGPETGIPAAELELARLELGLTLKAAGADAAALMERAAAAGEAERRWIATLARRHLEDDAAVRVLTALIRASRNAGRIDPALVRELAGELLLQGQDATARKLAASYLAARGAAAPSPRIADLARVAAHLEPDPKVRTRRRAALRPVPVAATPASPARDPAAELRRMRALARRPGLQAALADVVATLPPPLDPGVAIEAARLLLDLDELPAARRVAVAAATLPPLEAALIRLALAGPSGEAAAWDATVEAMAAGASLEGLDWWIREARERRGPRAAAEALAPLAAAARGPHRAEILDRIAALHEEAGEILRGFAARLQALEVTPTDPTRRRRALARLHPRVDLRHMLHGWWAHIENDPRFAVPMARMWARTGKARRGHWPLLKARKSTPRDPEVAGALGALLSEFEDHDGALAHLEAATRLRFFAYHPDESPFLAREHARRGNIDRVLELYALWMSEHPDPVLLAGELAALGSAFSFRDRAAALAEELGVPAPLPANEAD